VNERYGVPASYIHIRLWGLPLLIENFPQIRHTAFPILSLRTNRFSSHHAQEAGARPTDNARPEIFTLPSKRILLGVIRQRH